MCGIGGFIGQSKNPKVSYELTTQIFRYLETRGQDAAGFWGVSSEGVIYHKEPIKATEFVKRSMWHRVEAFNPNILLIHARATSPNGGHARKNKNNHPFTSADKRIGLIHNGFISEFDFLKNKYETLSECDSEVLLRMYESSIDQKESLIIPGTPDYVQNRMAGIHDIWSIIERGAMAVAVGERLNDDAQCLFLFRNDKRPLWLADVREQFGQIFFFSSVDIWFRAVRECSANIRSMLENQKLVELPISQVWFFATNAEDPVVTEDNFMRFNIEFNRGKYEEWKPDKYINVPTRRCNIPVITGLDDNEEVINGITPRKTGRKREAKEGVVEPYQGSIEAMESLVDDINTLLQSIQTEVTNTAMEGSLTEKRYHEVLTDLESAKQELEGTYRIIKS